LSFVVVVLGRRRRCRKFCLVFFDIYWISYIVNMSCHQSVTVAGSSDKVAIPVNAEMLGRKVVRRSEGGVDLADGVVVSYERLDASFQITISS